MPYQVAQACGLGRMTALGRAAGWCAMGGRGLSAIACCISSAAAPLGTTMRSLLGHAMACPCGEVTLSVDAFEDMGLP